MYTQASSEAVGSDRSCKACRDIRAPRQVGRTPLHLQVQQAVLEQDEYMSLLEALLAAPGIDVNARFDEDAPEVTGRPRES